MNEEAFFPLLRFAAYAAQPDHALRLDEGALLIAELAYPTLAHARYLRQLDTLAVEVWAELGPAMRQLRRSLAGRRDAAEQVIEAMRKTLAVRHHLHGADDAEAYNPRNSFLNDALDHHVGLPITLSAIYLAVARRLGVPLQGVSFPARFMVKWPLSAEEGGDLYLDPFHGGERLDEDACRHFILSLLARAGDTPATWTPGGAECDSGDAERQIEARAARLRFNTQWSAAVGVRDILTRMLNNLKIVYLHRGELPLALAVIDRLVVLRPDQPLELRDRGLLRLAMNEALLADADLRAYLTRAPDAPEAARLRRRLLSLSGARARLN
jgi:regulator of sirC expression with transglutaminase-like and TPR domain